MTGQNQSLLFKIWRVFATSFVIACGYILFSVAFYFPTGIKLPEPFYNSDPHTVNLADPSFDPLKYNYDVSPTELQSILDSRSFNRTYQANIFDCSDMSMETARYLQEEKGYDTSVIGDDLDNKVGHAWVYVWTGKNSAFAIETTANLYHRSLGQIMGDDWWDSYITVPGLALAHESGNRDEFYYPTNMRPTLHVLEWNEVKGR